jgi:hypothetical protein
MRRERRHLLAFELSDGVDEEVAERGPAAILVDRGALSTIWRRIEP